VAAMSGEGTLTIRTQNREGLVRFTVRDTGVGIPPENRGKIFTPFFTTKQAGRGTGLGLAVSYGIVKMHRGDIKVESNADPSIGPTGTSFTVTLPAGRAGEGDRTGEPVASAQAGEPREEKHVG
jgi:signal transduction histidine kinase